MPGIAAEEASRLAALQELAILDTPPEQLYDDVVALAAAICEVPIAAINFIDADRQWSKALVGVDTSEAPRNWSLCAQAILEEGGVLVVPDASSDPRWADNPLVTGKLGLRFYAGAAIVTDEGHALGTVCVVDTRGPRQLDEQKVEALRVLARQTASHLKLRRQTFQLADANKLLHALATKDALTGLPNRGTFHEALALALRQRGDTRLAILFCDLNGFKQINDRLGHHAGDELLKLVAERMQQALRDGDLVARYGGDEFVVLCQNIEPANNLDGVIDRLIATVRTPVKLDGTEIVPHISIGAAIADTQDDADTLLRRADLAMYDAKPKRRQAHP
jgi:diguanylate cyclase (GGDEF)-like protein